MTATIKVGNVVVQIDFKKSLDLDKLHDKLYNTKYYPDEFLGIIHKPKPKGAALIFPSGKIVFTGITPEKKALKLAQKLVDEIIALKCFR